MIEYRSISKTFADGTEAVADFSLELPSRTTTVLVGSSGCGKTTLLRMVNRMVDPTHGQVLIDDVDVATRNRVELRRSIGYVMQHAGLLPHRKVIDNVATVLRLNGVGKEAGQRAGARRARDRRPRLVARRASTRASSPAASSSGSAWPAGSPPTPTSC